MTPEMVLQLGRNALEITLILAGPVLLFGLVAGLVVAVFQALTQINEQTLTFVPKILAVFAALVVTGPWLMQSLVGYTTNLFTMLPAMVR